MKPRKVRDERVELLRIIACFMVIVIHIRPFAFSGTTLRSSAVLIYVLSGPAVAIFFMISGFFLRAEQSIPRMYMHFLTGILLPTVLFILAVSFLRAWIDQPGVSILESIRMAQPISDLRSMAEGFFCLDVVRFGRYCEHLWYILSYIGIMLWAPIIIGLLRGHQERLLLFMLLLCIFRYTIENLNTLWPLPLLPYLPECVGKPTMYAIAGLLLYRFLKKQREAKRQLRGWRLFFLTLGIAISILLFLLQRALFLKGLQQGQDPNSLNASYYYTSWSGMLCGLQSLSIVGFCLLLPDLSGLAAWIRTLGSYTFPIYLIHFVLVNHFRALGLETLLQSLFGSTAPGLILYTLCYGILIFLLSMLPVFLYRKLRVILLSLLETRFPCHPKI